MLVLYSCGLNSSRIADKLKSQVDNADFETYATVDEYIAQSRLRHQVFDRLVFSSKFLKSEDDLETLAQFLRSESSNTEIVFIMSNKDLSFKDAFDRNFNSPLYTSIIIDAPAMKYMVDAVKLSIIDLRVRFTNNTQKSSSKIGEIRGGKNSSSINQNQKNNSNSSVTSENIGDIEMNNLSDVSMQNSGDTTVSTAPIGTTEGVGNTDFSPYANSFFDTSSNSDELNQSGDISDFSAEDDDLSIGEFGNQHVDSGFVGDDDLDELEEFKKSKENIVLDAEKSTEVPAPEDDNVYMRGMGTIEFREEDEAIPAMTHPIVDNKAVAVEGVAISKQSKKLIEKGINIITGLGGSGATAFIVRLATALVKKRARVLIVDLDISNNGILSFINAKNFYIQKCDNGIINMSTYSEDGVDIISNGYGGSSGVMNIFNKEFLRNYDVVLIDCPLENLNLIPDGIFTSSNVIISCIADISKLIETTSVISNREYVSLKKEVYLNTCSKVANRNINSEDIMELKNVMLMPNGCWLK